MSEAISGAVLEWSRISLRSSGLRSCLGNGGLETIYGCAWCHLGYFGRERSGL